MKNLWLDEEVKDDEFEKAIYLSKLLNQEKFLINNHFAEISFKIIDKNIFGEEGEYLAITNRGISFNNLSKESFSLLEKSQLDKLINLKNLDDELLFKFISNASIDTLVHNIIPFKYVLFTTPEPLLAISNSKNSQEKITNIFGEKILFIPYIKPGTIFAKSLYDIFKQIDWTQYNGVFVQHYGLFTFNEDIKVCYDNLVSDVNKVADYLYDNSIVVCGDEERERKSAFSFIKNIFKKACTCMFGNKKDKDAKIDIDLLTLAKIRNKISKAAAKSLFIKYYDSKRAIHFSSLSNVDEFISYPPIIPHIVDKTRAFSVLFNSKLESEIKLFKTNYQNYFDEFKNENMELENIYPTWAIWKDMGAILVGNTKSEIEKLEDIVENTIAIQLKSELLGGYELIPNSELFDIEFNSDRPKVPLKKFAGKVVMINGASSEKLTSLINEFLSNGAVVIGLDIETAEKRVFESELYFGISIDLSNQSVFKNKIKEILLEFGGIDIFISNIGQNISLNDEKIELNNWQKFIDNNIMVHKAIMQEYKEILNESIEPRAILLGLKEFTVLPKEHNIVIESSHEQGLFFENCKKELSDLNIKIDYIGANILDEKLLKDIVSAILDSSFYYSEALNINIDK